MSYKSTAKARNTVHETSRMSNSARNMYATIDHHLPDDEPRKLEESNKSRTPKQVNLQLQVKAKHIAGVQCSCRVLPGAGANSDSATRKALSTSPPATRERLIITQFEPPQMELDRMGDWLGERDLSLYVEVVPTFESTTFRCATASW